MAHILALANAITRAQNDLVNSREGIALVFAIWSVPLLVVANYQWRNAERIAAKRADAFREDGFWTAFPWAWQRTTYGIRVGSAAFAASALILIVFAVLELLGVVPELLP